LGVHAVGGSKGEVDLEVYLRLASAKRKIPPYQGMISTLICDYQNQVFPKAGLFSEVSLIGDDQGRETF
jgi:hypothetical protein